MREEKRLVRNFYETFGWKKVAAAPDSLGKDIRGADGAVFADSAVHVDMRPALTRYHARCEARVDPFLPKRGGLFLEIGSGATPKPRFSVEFRRHVCADFAKAALDGAREKLGARGLYVQADITALPFRDGAFDASAALHVLYHVPADEQEAVVRELHRTLAAGGRSVVIGGVVSRDSLLYKLSRFLIRGKSAARKIRFFFRRAAPASGGSFPEKPLLVPPPSYYHAHPYTWFLRTFPPGWVEDVRCWCMFDRHLSETFVPQNWFGAALLRIVEAMEENFPRLTLLFGVYPFLVLRKE